MKNKSLIIAGTLAVLAALFFLASHFYKKSETKRLGDLAEQSKVYFEREYSPTLGNNMARVTLVEFLDPECEACRVFHPIVKDILKEFDGAVRLVVRYAPFHQNSKFAVQLLEAARMQGKYWETLDLFFKNQPQWGDHHDPKPLLLWDYLAEVGVDIEQLKVDVKAPLIRKIIEQDIIDGQQLGVRRTPSFFVNGKPLQEFGPDQLRALIQSEISR